ncbi:hypothetical protein GCM10027406_28570 [Leifsonia lichenia]
MKELGWEQRDLLPGLSGNAWAGKSLWCFGVWALSAVMTLFGVLASRGRYQYFDPFSLVCLAFFTVSLGLGFLFSWVSTHKIRKEIAAGYTTSTTGDNHVERRHSPTGVVMRAAGEPNLTKPQWEAAMRRVRAFEEHQKRERARTEKRSA